MKRVHMSLAEFIYTEILKPKPLRKLTNALLLHVIIREKVRYGPAVLRLNLNDPVLSGALTLRVFERSELHFFQQYCLGDMTLVDIGANLGLYTALAIHNLNPAGRILAIEPHPGVFTLLQQNVADNLHLRPDGGPRVDAFQLAATPKAGTLPLRMNPENQADNRMYHGTYQGKLEDWGSTSVKTQPVDALLSRLGLREVNFVKMDIQGYEQQALHGFMKSLRHSPRTFLMTEFWPKGLREAGGDALAYLDELASLGFTLYELKERPRGRLVPLGNWEALVRRLPGRKYTNLVGVKGYTL
jgi:FkbM family methyltransferase